MFFGALRTGRIGGRFGLDPDFYRL